MTSTHLDEEPAEHRRFARYLQALEGVAEADEADLVAAILRDPHLSERQKQVLIDVYASFRTGAEPRPAGDGQAGPWPAPTGEASPPAAASGSAPQAAGADKPAPARPRRGRP